GAGLCVGARVEVRPHAPLDTLEHDTLLGRVDVAARIGDTRLELVRDLSTYDVPLRPRVDQEYALGLLGDADALDRGAQALCGVVENARDPDERDGGERREDDEDDERLRD